MTSGQMLLAGFNGLFTKVAGELTDMFTSFEQVHFDKFELQFDIVKDAQDLQVRFFLITCITRDKRIPSVFMTLFMSPIGAVRQKILACL